MAILIQFMMSFLIFCALLRLLISLLSPPSNRLASMRTVAKSTKKFQAAWVRKAYLVFSLTVLLTVSIYTIVQNYQEFWSQSDFGF